MLKVFTQTLDDVAFSAINQAEKWCREQGYSVGTMCSLDPMGIKKGIWRIAKWRNLSITDINLLDGRITTTNNFRYGPVTVEINNLPIM